MGLAGLVANAVAIAKQVTASLQVAITLTPCNGEDTYGNRTYDATKTSVYQVIYEQRERWVTSKEKGQQLSKSSVLFLDPIAIKNEDEIILPDGSKPQIISISGVSNPDGVIYAPEVFF